MPASDEVIFFLTTCIILMIVFLILSTVLWNELKKKEKTIAELSKKITGTEKEISKRNAFRVDFSVKKCEYSIIEVANQASEHLEWKDGEMKDISFSGMKLTSDKAIPIRQGVKVKIKCNLEGENVTLVGNVVRQEIYSAHQQMTYGIQFTKDPQNQNALFKALNKINHYRQHIGVPNAQATEKVK
ncbi:PilZ domain-containing protein [Salicibibacter kimchii]|uniref:PilZ domain-containing protein n=1 Tax=Salicibibacter kimchii TaxID=2099786 RepID=A0A345BX62_9BACI|nr:PilZ domain-containing protein [Salicibibacter kimchii]AXF55543.1 PilZ domain-containing protein [Salicibibacter kimchii]